MEVFNYHKSTNNYQKKVSIRSNEMFLNRENNSKVQSTIMKVHNNFMIMK